MAGAPRSWRDWRFRDWVLVAALAVVYRVLLEWVPLAVSLPPVVAAAGLGLHRLSRGHREDGPGGPPG